MMTELELVEKRVVVGNEFGLHARVATAVVQTMRRHCCHVTLSKESMEVDARSVLGLLLLAATNGTEILIRANGPESEKAVREICELLHHDDSNHDGQR
jgi:phosphotransferase system HPr (HPr) family protein